MGTSLLRCHIDPEGSMRHLFRRTCAAVAAVALAATMSPAAAVDSTDEREATLTLWEAGGVVRSAPLPKELWIPRATSRAWKLSYLTYDAHGEPARSTGTVFIPHGTPPRGGWPVISWAHGLSGLGDDC